MDIVCAKDLSVYLRPIDLCSEKMSKQLTIVDKVKVRVTSITLKSVSKMCGIEKMWTSEFFQIEFQTAKCSSIPCTPTMQIQLKLRSIEFIKCQIQFLLECG